jgi:N-acetylglucosamine-6-phosphate deacetylase
MPVTNPLTQHDGACAFVRFTNSRIIRGDKIVHEDLWIHSLSGTLCDPPQDGVSSSDVHVVDLRGALIAPGFIDVQINGAFGFDFSNSDCLDNPDKFQQGLDDLNHRLIQTGTTSYLPTMTSQFSQTYHNVSEYSGKGLDASS